MNFELKINDKLSLKIPELSDAPAIFAVTEKDKVHLGEFLAWAHENTLEKTEGNLKQRIEDFEAKKAASFCIRYDGQWIGSVGFISLSQTHNKGEIGYWLASDFEGKGLMTECVKACINYGFKECGLNRIYIRCDTRNVKSAGIPKRLGFVHEGTLREDQYLGGQYNDMLLYGLLKDEWKN
jgi:ribosomal-protein-serine acetyltransferase